MKNEIKRALFKKSNLILVAAIFGLMFLNAYYSGLKTALTVNASSDLRNMEDVIFTKKYYGNMYRVWKNAYYLMQALAPLFLAAPYLNTYLSEKTGHFRYFCTCRKGEQKICAAERICGRAVRDGRIKLCGAKSMDLQARTVQANLFFLKLYADF